ncbi:MAG: hypothetical protein GVY11_06770 [Gammaproteobacteria bacterium]|jgi:polyisoprenoid-binding protein YceI|nr:hypothetical protein [Gammaproteobacteria bacterium]
MNRFARIVLFGVALGALSAASAEPREFRIDPDHFSVAFRVAHIGYADQIGLFLDAEGRFVYDPEANELASGEVTIAADSVFTNHDRRDDHLRDDDFLDASRHETIRFEAREWRPDGPDSGTLAGDLTLLGKSRPVELNVTLNKLADYPFGHRRPTLGVSATATIRRSEWGMRYALEDGLVGDEVRLLFEFEAIAESLSR